MLYRIVLGDWSGDGHSREDTRLVDITSGHTVEEMQENYRKNCERWGASLKTIAQEYEDSAVDEDLYEKMKADGAKWECDAIVGPYEPMLGFPGGYQEPYLTPDDALTFAMDFIGCGIEYQNGKPLEWHEVREEAPILIGTWNAPIETSFGYGLFYS